MGTLKKLLAQAADEVATLQQRGPRIAMVAVDDQGIVKDDGSTAIKPYVGRHVNSVRGRFKVYIGFDPREV